jgi:ATP-dependent Clp protease ATP-binding subunit ClpC
MARTIQRLVENELSRMVLSGEVEPGDKARVDADGDELKFDVEKGAASQEVSGWSEESAAAQTREPAAVQ